MPDNNDLANVLRTVIQEEMQSVRQEVRTIVQEELKPVNERLSALEAGQQDLKQDVQELKKGQAAIEAAVNDLRAINRRTHKEVFNQLYYMG